MQLGSLILVVFTILYYPSVAWSSEYKSVCSLSEKDVQDAKQLIESSRAYLSQLKSINSDSFKRIDASPETIAALVDEKYKVVEAFQSILVSAESIASKSTSCPVKDWNNIMFNLSVNLRYMEDLERYKLIKDCEVCWFAVVVTAQAHENIDIKINSIIDVK